MNHLLLTGVVAAVATFLLLFMSFDTLEFTEMGLNYSWITENIEEQVYEHGRYYLGLGHKFIKFPKMVRSVVFSNDPSGLKHGPALESRTNDGLRVQLEVSFQYKLKVDEVNNMYMTLGPEYQQTFVRMAIDQITAEATLHNAYDFFANRTLIAVNMHSMLDTHFRKHGFSEVPFLQLRTVHLPTVFEDAISKTQLQEQDIQIAKMEQKANTVLFETRVLQAERTVQVISNNALAEAAAILLANSAFCEQYLITQRLQTLALKGLMANTSWTPERLLDYLRVRALRQHPSENTIIRI